MTWEIIRASGFVAYGMLALSVILGLLVSSKLFGRSVSPKGLTFLHESLAVGSLIATAAHLVALGLDDYVEFGVTALLVPGMSAWEPQAVAFGVVAMWTLAVVTFSFYVRKRIGQRAWRIVHYGAFGSFATALAHGLLAGTDSGHPGAIGLYAGTGAVVAVLLVARVMLAGEGRRPARTRAGAV
jgi:hypothetical protein